MATYEEDMEVVIDLDVSAISAKIANDPTFLALLRANQLKRARTQIESKPRYVVGHTTPPPQTRKIT